MAPGEDAFAILPESVVAFDYETAELHVSAHRFTMRDHFRVVVESRIHNGFVQCASDDRFDRLLREFESLQISRRLDEKQIAKLSRSREYHRLRLASAAPMDAYEAVLTPLSNSLLSIEIEGLTYELRLSTRVVDQLGKSCGTAPAQAR
jgi:hypothetical protein